MAATKWPRLFVDPQWRYELKWDGVRTLLYFDGESTRLRSRAGNDVSAKYPELTEFAATRPTILDGEIVAFDESGRPSFERLQGRMNLGSSHLVREATERIPITYVAFDALYDGGDILSEGWEERRARLDALPMSGRLARSDIYEGDPDPIWAFVLARNLEGVVAKRLGSPYRPGSRSPDWRKIASVRSLRAVVGGYLPGEGRRRASFGSLLIGLWSGDRLRVIGSVGTGFDDRALAAIKNALDEMITDASPFHPDPLLSDHAIWVSPRLVAVVQFREWTMAGRLRAPVFRGFSDDPVESITWEAEGPEA